MDNHEMMIEFGVNMQIGINSLAKNVYTDKLFADLRSLVELLDKVELSDENAITGDAEEQLTREKQRLSDIIGTKYSNMIGIISNALAEASSQQTDLGTRMTRLTLIEVRLADDRLSYKKLLSDNEDTDMVEASYLLNESTAVYNASLQAGAGIIQLTLANFIS